MEQQLAQPTATQATTIIDSAPPSLSAPRGFTRCRAHNRSGSRCRLHVQDPLTGLCFRHATRPDPALDLIDLSTDLFGSEPAEFQTPERINDVLAKVVQLLAQGRISPRRAAVITYTCNLLLRSVVVIDRKLEAEVPPLIFERPGPVHDDTTARHQPSPDQTGAGR